MVDYFILIPILVVLALAGIVFVLARTHPVLFRMGLRNALRRKAQTAIVIAGLMMGTAIISGSLASGDSLEYGIRKAAYDSLGPADVLIQTDGQLHYSEVLYDDLAANASVRAVAQALSPILYEEGALTNPVKHLSEPRISVIGIDPALNKPFGTFRTTMGTVKDGNDLGADGIYIAESIAKKLEVNVGDTIDLNYAKPLVPRVPRIYTYNGSLTAGAGVCPLPQIPQACQYVAPPGEAATFSVPVQPGAVGITSIVFGFGPNANRTDLDQTLRSPEGAAFVNANGTPLAPDNPSILNVTTDSTLATGDWSWEIRAKIAADQPFSAIALVFYEEYNLTALQEFARQAEAQGFDFSSLGDITGGMSEGESAQMTVRAVVTSDGFGDFLLGQNAFVSKEAAQRLYGMEGKINVILASASSDAEVGPSLTAPLMEVIPKAVNASADAHPESPALKSVKAVAVKERFLDAAERAGKLFKQFLTTIGSFTVIAGIMLIINIFIMLAEERKSELGMARAVGLTRGQLVYLFSFEGFLYALVASGLGSILGLGIARGLIFGFNEIFASSDRERGILSIPFHAEPASIVWAFAAGFVITLATVLVASWRVSRLNIVRAIRRIEEPPTKAGRTTYLIGWGMVLLGGAWGLYGLLTNDFVARILGPSIGLMGSGLVLSRHIPAKWAYPIAGAGVAAYSGWTIFTFGNPEGLVNAVMGPIRGVFIVLAAVLILIYVPQLVTFTSWVLIRIRPLIPAVRPGVAYPLGKKLRTGLTTTMFALVILVVIAFSIFGATFKIDLKQQSGGYDVEGDTTVPIVDLEAFYAENRDPALPDPFARVEYHDDLRYALEFGGTAIRINGERINYQGPPVDYIYSYDEGFARNNRYEFESLEAQYATARDAYEAVLRDRSLVIVSIAYNFDEQGQPGQFKVGDTLTLDTPSGAASFRIIGFQKQFYLGGIFVHPDVLDSSFQRIRGEYLFKLKAGENPDTAAKEIEAAFEKGGMNAESIEAQAEKQLEQNRRFLTLFQLFLGFGLVVGIASLGIVTARNVIERRQEIGMLRAVGYPRKQILRIFFIEIFFTTTLGILIGGLIGIIVSYGVVASTPSLASLGVKYTIPWLDIAQILGLVYLAVFAATYWPARRGSNVPPAEAVRYIE